MKPGLEGKGKNNLWQKSDTFQPLRFENRHDGLDHGVVMATKALVLQDT
jgi:hypothetical protein